MKRREKFLTVGGAHWDILGRAPIEMELHDDVGGHIRRMIGGVAGPVAMKLGKLKADVEIICYAGHDELGEALLSKLGEFGVSTHHAIRGEFPTDVYMGIEAPNGLIAAIADCHSLEQVSEKAIEALKTKADENTHLIVDGNLHDQALKNLSEAKIDCERLTLVPASPGKIMRFKHFIDRNPAQIIVNLREASLLAQAEFDDSAQAAQALVTMGFSSALVTNSAQTATFADKTTIVSALPPDVEVKRFTGAGDTLAGHFLFAQANGDEPKIALEYALYETSQFISVEDRDA